MNLSNTGALSSVAFFRPYLKKIGVTISIVLCLGAVVSMLHDVEYTGQDISVRGLRIFTWLKLLVPKSFYTPRELKLPRQESVLFARGLDSLRPEYIEQGAVYDCRFLATVASLCASESSRRQLFSFIMRIVRERSMS